MKRILFSAVVVVQLSACGPMYETRYSFLPPAAPEGRVCVGQCDTSRFRCRQVEEMRAEQSAYRSEWEHDRCEQDIRWRKGRDPKWYECGSSSYSADYDNCDNEYRSCYQTCGGEVRAETICVANCDQIVRAR